METLSEKLTHHAWAQQLNEAMTLKLKATDTLLFHWAAKNNTQLPTDFRPVNKGTKLLKAT